jgi:hypothetical protein
MLIYKLSRIIRILKLQFETDSITAVNCFAQYLAQIFYW